MTPGAGVPRETYRELLLTARRFARSEADAHDLVQDVLEIALARGVTDWASAGRRAWLRGVVCRHAAFVARGHRRRQRREQMASPAREASAGEGAGTGAWSWEPRFLAKLPRSVRSVAILVSADFCAAEIRWLLRLPDTALRQRLSALRRALRAHGEPPTLPTSEAEAPTGFGALRNQVLAHLRRRGGRAVATQDPDGHVLFLQMSAHRSTADGNLREEPACPSLT
jgi:RNA polymerase sigma-70 factor (ECF subfamily)